MKLSLGAITLWASVLALSACAAPHQTKPVQTSSAVVQGAQGRSADALGNGCGSVSYPESGQTGTVQVQHGSVECDTAVAVVNRFLRDPGLLHEGNTMSAQFDGWLCASPTAVAAAQYGSSTECTRGQDTIWVVSAMVAPVGLTEPAAPPAAECDDAAVSAGLGGQVRVLRCYGTWAYVTAGELGDSTSLAQLKGSKWRRYTGFPSSICRAQAASDGVPPTEVASFRDC